MKNNNSFLTSSTTLLMVIFLIMSCKKDVTENNQNIPPKVNAGTDMVITLPVDSIELTGSGSDTDGSIVSYAWRNTIGPSSFIIEKPGEAVTKVKNLKTGVYGFELKATDNAGASSKDTVYITVNASKEASTENYRSKKSGTWNEASNWERFDGSNWSDASRAPYNIDGRINILNGHIITLTLPVEIDQLIINEGAHLKVKSDLSLSDEFATNDDDYELINNGTLDWQDGEINFLGGYSIVTLVNNGEFIISGNNKIWSYWWDSEARLINNGIITKTSTGYTGLEYIHYLTNTSTGLIQGIGSMSVNGDISWIPDGFKNNGTIAPGLPIGILTIDSALKPFSLSSVLNIEVKDNSGPGTGHDQLIFNKYITLNGTLTVTEIGTSVSSGKFTILSTSGTIAGKFNNINLPPGYSLQINSNSIDLIKN
jgi:hypothetical protein